MPGPNFLHGADVIEQSIGGRPVRAIRTAVIGLVGTAPVFEVAAEDQTLNKLTLVQNRRDAAKYFGAAREGYTIPQALDAIFDQGVGLVVVVNVFNPATHKLTVTNAAKTFAVDTEQVLTNHHGLAAVVVKSDDLATTYTVAVDYTVDLVNGVITRVPGGAIASGAAVKVSYTHANPAAVTASEVIGTISPGGARSGMQCWSESLTKFGYGAKILIAPVYCTQLTVATELAAQAVLNKALALVDAPAGTTVQDAIEGRGPSGSINFNFSSDRLALCYPHLKVLGPDGNIVLEPLSQRLAGVIAAVDLNEGTHVSPSNHEILGIVGMEFDLSAGLDDANSDVNLLNEAGIVTVFNAFGTGFRVWGNRSSAWPADTHPKCFIAIRREADKVEAAILQAQLPYIDKPLNRALVDEVVESTSRFINQEIGAGALVDGSCWFDPEDNQTANLSMGHLTLRYELMGPTPTERITFLYNINPDLLQAITA